MEKKRKIYKKKRSIIKEFYLEIYPRYVAVARNATEKAINMRYSERDGSDIHLTEDEQNCCAVTLSVRRRKDQWCGFLVILNEDQDDDKYSTCAHEAAHVWLFIKESLGIYGRDENAEIDAYPIGWITSKIYSVYMIK